MENESKRMIIRNDLAASRCELRFIWEARRKKVAPVNLPTPPEKPIDQGASGELVESIEISLGELIEVKPEQIVASVNGL